MTRAGVITGLAGLAVILLAGITAPAPRATLFDGAAVEEPYRFVEPGAGQAGDPRPVSTTEPVSSGQSPALSVATGESPPQAQLLAARGALVVSPSTLALTVVVDPVAPTGIPVGRTAAGNAYRVQVVDQDNREIAIGDGASVSVVLRAPAGTRGATMMQRPAAGSAWQVIPSAATGLSDLYLSTPVNSLGEFVLVSVPSSLSGAGPGGLGWVPLALAAIAGSALIGFGLREQRRRSPRAGGRGG